MNDHTWELMQKHLDAESFYMVSSQDSAPSATELRRTASELRCVFPDEFVAHSSNKYGGLYVEVKEELWPRAREFEVGPFWSFLYGLFTFNIADGIPEFMDLAENARRFQAETELHAVPFMKIIGDADLYCFNAAGHIVRYNHELNELEEDNRSFFDVLDSELGELVERKDRKLGVTSAVGELAIYNGVDCDNLIATLCVLEAPELMDTIRDIRKLAEIPLADVKRALSEATTMCSFSLAERGGAIERQQAIVTLEEIKSAIVKHGGAARIDLSLPGGDLNRVDCSDEELAFVKERLLQWG